jgi:hypothetical protein
MEHVTTCRPGRRGRWRLALPAALLVAACQQSAMPPATMPPPPEPAYAPAPPPLSGASESERLAVARACASDIDRFCAGVPPRQGEIKACMKAHLTELSAGCFDAVMGAIAAAHPP